LEEGGMQHGKGYCKYPYKKGVSVCLQQPFSSGNTATCLKMWLCPAKYNHHTGTYAPSGTAAPTKTSWNEYSEEV
jgi:hypothetical protein